MRLFIGIDGGGTASRAVVVTSRGRIVSEGRSGPGNYHNVGLAKASGNLAAAARSAWLAAGLPAGKRPAGVFAGCAGIKSTVDVARLTLALERAGVGEAGTITVANDLLNAHAGGLAGGPGVALIAGTGTHCFGRDRGGCEAFCGGWGWLLDDVGGGAGLALAGLRLAVRAADGRFGESAVLPAAMAFFGTREPGEILTNLHTQPWPPEKLAGFAKVLTRLAADGDAGALSVLKEGAGSLAGLVATCAEKLRWRGRCNVVVLGGCARSGDPYQPLVEAAIVRALPRGRLVRPAGSPVEGAARNVLRIAGLPATGKLTGVVPS